MEFVLKTESDNEKEAVFEVPYEEFAEKYAINQVTPLKEEEAGLMENYLAMFRDIQEVHRIFLNFERQINGFIRYDLYGGYLFLVFMEAIFKKGYLPVSQDADGEFYYDLDSLEIRMKPEMDQELEMVFHFLKESLRREGYRPDRMSHYFILRNFMHAVAEVYLVLLSGIFFSDCRLYGQRSISYEKGRCGCFGRVGRLLSLVRRCKENGLCLQTGFSPVNAVPLYQLEARRFYEENEAGLSG